MVTENNIEAVVDAGDSLMSPEMVEILRDISATVSHPLMTTPFSEYTVTEGLLLILVIFCVLSICLKMIKGGFYWL